MRHTYNETQKEKICQMIYDWLLRYNAFSGEHVMQDDDCQIYASELLSEIADIKDVTEDLNKSDKKFDSIFEYTRTLKDGTDKWRFAIDTATKYAKENKNPNDYIEEIITNIVARKPTCFNRGRNCNNFFINFFHIFVLLHLN